MKTKIFKTKKMLTLALVITLLCVTAAVTLFQTNNKKNVSAVYTPDTAFSLLDIKKLSTMPAEYKGESDEWQLKIDGMQVSFLYRGDYSIVFYIYSGPNYIGSNDYFNGLISTDVVARAAGSHAFLHGGYPSTKKAISSYSSSYKVPDKNIYLNYEYKQDVSGETRINLRDYVLDAAGTYYYVHAIVTHSGETTKMYATEGVKGYAISDPVKEGYTFIGWYTDEALTVPFDGSPITGNVTLYAKFTINQFTLTFNANGGSAVSPKTIDWGTTTTYTTTTREGYAFLGWYTEAELVNIFDFNTLIKQDYTLYAKWGINRYYVIFNPNGGTAVANQQLDWGTTSTKPTDPTKEGHTFGGWYTDSGFTSQFNFTTLIKQEYTLYAKWIINKHTVTFTSSGSAVSSQTVDWGTTSTKPTDPTKEGYTFGGWYSDSGFTNSYNFGSVVKSDFTLYGKFIINKHTVTFTTNGGTAVNSQAVDWGTTITNPTTTRTGYTFGGWYTESGLTTSYNFSNLVKNDFTLYAKWSINRYTVTFNANGGTTVANQTVDYNTKLTAVTTSRTGYNFVSWNTDIDLTNSFTFDTLITDDMALYAKWEIKRFTVTFMVDGAVYGKLEVDYGTTLDELAAQQAQAFTALFIDEEMTSFDGTYRIYDDMIIFADPVPVEEEENGILSFFTNITPIKAVAGGAVMIGIVAVVILLISKLKGKNKKARR